jgi:hypothetical protein
VAGVILRERLPAFERMLWRACRGNVFLRQAEIEDPLEDPLLGGDEVYKSVFVIFFQVSISTAIDEQLFFTKKYYEQLFLHLNMCFILFLQKKIDKKLFVKCL